MAREGKAVKGIKIPITAETEEAKAALEELKKNFKDTADQINTSSERMFNEKAVANNLAKLSARLVAVRDNVQSFDNLTGFASLSDKSEEYNEAVQRMVKYTGLASDKIEMLNEKFGKHQAITQQVAALNSFKKYLGLSADESIALARELNVSSEAIERFSKQQDKAAKSSETATVKLAEYTGVAKGVGSSIISAVQSLKSLADLDPSRAFASQTKEYQAMIAGMAESAGVSVQKMNRMVQSSAASWEPHVAVLKKVQSSMNITAGEVAALASRYGVADAAVKAYTDSLEASAKATTKVQKRSSGSSGGALRGWFTPTSINNAAFAGASAFGLVGGAYGVAELTRSSVEASLALDNMKVAYQSIYNSSVKAGEQLQFVLNLSTELGLNFKSVAEGAKGVFAAAQGTELENKASSIVSSFSKMGAALKLSDDQMKGVFLAINQMISKGKVSAEELRTQLAERMPGAVNLFAKAIGKTTAELDKMLQDGKVTLEDLAKFSDAVGEKYAAGAAGASGSLQAEINRLSSSWFLLKASLVNSDALAGAVRMVTSLVDAMSQNPDGLRTAIELVGKAAGIGAGVALVTSAAKSVKEYSTQVAAAAEETSKFNKVMGMVSGALPTIAITGTIVALTELWSWLNKDATEFERFVNKMGGGNARGASNKAYFDNLKNEYENFIKDFNTNFGTRFQNIVEKSLYSQQSAKYGGEFFDYAYIQKIEDGMSTFNTLSSEISEMFKKGETDTNKYAETMEKITSILRDMEKAARAAGNTELADEFARAGKSMAGASDNAQLLSGKLQDAKKSMEDLISVSKFNEGFGSLLKSAQATDLGRQLTGEGNVEDYIKSLVNLRSKLDDTYSKLEDMATGTDTYNAALKASYEQSEQFGQAITLVAQASVKAGSDLATIIPLVEDLGQKANLSATQIMGIQGALAVAFSAAKYADAEKAIRKLNFQTAHIGDKTGLAGTSAVAGKLGEAADVEALYKRLRSKQSIAGLEKDKGGVYTEADAEIAQRLYDATARQLEVQAALTASKKKSYEFDASAFEKKVAALEASNSEHSEDVSTARRAKLNADLDDLNDKLKKAKISIDSAYANGLQSRLESAYKKSWIQEDLKSLDSLESKVLEFDREYAKTVLGDDSDAASASYIRQAKEYKKSLQNLLKAQEVWAQDSIANEEERGAKIVEFRQAYAERLVQIDEWEARERKKLSGGVYDNLSLAADEYYNKHKNFARGLGDLYTQAADSMSSALGNFALSGMQDFNSLADAFNNMVDEMLSALAKLLAQQAVSSIASLAFSAFGGFFGGSSSTTSSSVGGSQWIGGTGLGNINYAQERGGVNNGVSGYANAILDRPTMLTYSSHVSALERGGVLAGERPGRKEAVMPLVRDSAGDLAVKGVNSNSNSDGVEVNVFNSSGQKTSVRRSVSKTGQRSIDVMIGDTLAKQMLTRGTSVDKAISARTGNHQVVRNR